MRSSNPPAAGTRPRSAKAPGPPPWRPLVPLAAGLGRVAGTGAPAPAPGGSGAGSPSRGSGPGAESPGGAPGCASFSGRPRARSRSRRGARGRRASAHPDAARWPPARGPGRGGTSSWTPAALHPPRGPPGDAVFAQLGPQWRPAFEWQAGRVQGPPGPSGRRPRAPGSAIANTGCQFASTLPGRAGRVRNARRGQSRSSAAGTRWRSKSPAPRRPRSS
mmetsp:Transcript_3149/g.10157  ORF Transcript_3149/g.10157 Transcript_3149/m.10157 type:complete len:219 (-) Transcript_3149:297-953(-)